MKKFMSKCLIVAATTALVIAPLLAEARVARDGRVNVNRTGVRYNRTNVNVNRTDVVRNTAVTRGNYYYNGRRYNYYYNGNYYNYYNNGLYYLYFIGGVYCNTLRNGVCYR